MPDMFQYQYAQNSTQNVTSIIQNHKFSVVRMDFIMSEKFILSPKLK